MDYDEHLKKKLEELLKLWSGFLSAPNLKNAITVSDALRKGTEKCDELKKKITDFATASPTTKISIENLKNRLEQEKTKLSAQLEKLQQFKFVLDPTALQEMYTVARDRTVSLQNELKGKSDAEQEAILNMRRDGVVEAVKKLTDESKKFHEKNKDVVDIFKIIQDVYKELETVEGEFNRIRFMQSIPRTPEEVNFIREVIGLASKEKAIKRRLDELEYICDEIENQSEERGERGRYIAAYKQHKAFVGNALVEAAEQGERVSDSRYAGIKKALSDAIIYFTNFTSEFDSAEEQVMEQRKVGKVERSKKQIQTEAKENIALAWAKLEAAINLAQPFWQSYIALQQRAQPAQPAQ